eukprot:1351621-Amphidinium_carterae.1
MGIELRRPQNCLDHVGCCLSGQVRAVSFDDQGVRGPIPLKLAGNLPGRLQGTFGAHRNPGTLFGL